MPARVWTALAGLIAVLLIAAVALGLTWVFGAVALHAPGTAQLRGDVQRSEILRSLNGVDMSLKASLPAGPSWRRYVGDRYGEAQTLESLGYTYHHLGNNVRAATHYRRRHRCRQRCRDRA